MKAKKLPTANCSVHLAIKEFVLKTFLAYGKDNFSFQLLIECAWVQCLIDNDDSELYLNDERDNDLMFVTSKLKYHWANL